MGIFVADAQKKKITQREKETGKTWGLAGARCYFSMQKQLKIPIILSQQRKWSDKGYYFERAIGGA